NATTVTLNGFLSCYCNSSAQYSGYTNIGNVSFGTLNNGTATPLFSNPNNNLYTDYTALTPYHTYAQGQTYDVSVASITGSTYFSQNWINIFIDYNQDGIYDPVTERAYNGNITANGVPTAGTITIPATALLGTTGMRVTQVEYGSATSSPCGVSGYGETEDYRITIIVPPAYDLSVVTLVTPTVGECLGTNETVTVRIKNTGLQPIDFSTDYALIGAESTGPNATIFPDVPLSSGLLAPGATMDVVITNTFNMSAPGTYCFTGSIVAFSTDGNPANDVMPIGCRTNIAPETIDYLQTFNGSTAWPAGWSNNLMYINGGTGVGGTNAVRYNHYYVSTPNPSITSPKIGPVTLTSHLFFDYRIINYSGGAGFALPNGAAIQIYVSEDCGLSYQLFQTIDNTNHVTSSAYANKSWSLINYMGDELKFRVELVYGGSGDYYVDIDNFEVRNLPAPPPNDLSAFAIISPATTGCYSANQAVTVRVMNTGSDTVDFANDPTLVGATVDLPGAGVNPVWLEVPVSTGTLAPGQYLDVQVTTFDMTAGGTYTFSGFVVYSSDLVPGNDTISNVVRTVVPSMPLDYLETFNSGTTVPAGWATNLMYIGGGIGVNGSNALRYNHYYISTPNPSATSPKIGPITANSHLIFDYRIINYSGGAGFNLGANQGTKINIYVSEDCGQSFQLFQTIDHTNHVTSASYANVQYPLGAAYNGENLIVRMELVYGGTGDYYVDIDNFEIRNLFPINISATELLAPTPNSSVCFGDATQDVTVQIQNMGSDPLDMSVNNVTISGSISDGTTTTPISLVVNTGTLAINATQDITVLTGYNMSATGTYTINLAASVAGDGDTTNNDFAPATVTVSSPAITATNDTVTICAPGNATLTATANLGDVKWFDTATGGTALATGSSFTTNVTANTTFYAAASTGTSATTHNTTMASGNGASGNIFAIHAINPVTILSFDGYPSSTGNWSVYYRPDNYANVPGANTSAAGWILVGTANNVVPLPGTTPTPIPIPVNITIPSGQTWSFQVMSTGSVNYTNGTAVGNVFNANSDFEFLEGHGGSLFAATNSPRVFNGAIHYSGGCESARTPVHVVINPVDPITVDNTTTTICDGGTVTLSVLNPEAGVTYTWMPGGMTGATVTATPAATMDYTVTGNNAACSETAIVTVTVNPVPVATASGNSPVFMGDVISLSASGGMSYNWSGPNGFASTSQNPEITNATLGATGTYTVVVTSNGCSDTATVSIAVVDPSTPLVGLYTINQTAPASPTNFTSFTTAATFLNTVGVSGPVTINVVPTTSPYVTQQFLLGNIPGTSAANTVTINGNGETITFCGTAGNRDIVRLDATKWINLNNLNIVGTCGYGWGIHLLNGADNVTLSGNTVTVNSTSSIQAPHQGIIAVNSFTDPQAFGNATNNLHVVNNIVNGGYNGIRINGSPGVASTGLVVEGNTVNDAYEYGLYVLYNDGPVVKDNQVSMRAGNIRSTAVMINRIENGLSFTGNHVKNAGRRSVYMHSVNYNTTPSSPSIIANNMIAGGIQNGTVGDGMYLNFVKHLGIYHNSVLLDNAASGYA
ncbi:MAG: hypothetical protein EOP51_16445, partial [Sphingobacteriales bacterium]